MCVAEPIQVCRAGGPIEVLGINLREVYGNLSSDAVCHWNNNMLNL